MENELKGFYQIFYGDNLELEQLLEHFNLEKFKTQSILENDENVLANSEEIDLYNLSNIWKYFDFDFENSIIYPEEEIYEAEIY